MTAVHINVTRPTAKFAKAGKCPDCKKRTRFLGFFTPWYGHDSTCLRCGREWCDGEWVALPFCRGARAENIEAAKRKWRSLPPMRDNHRC